jgi:exopolysaccharide production protein ExoZ
MTGLTRGRGLSTLVSIQYLRAAAAIMVVYYHIFSNRVAEHWAGGRNFGLSGVDIFFVISGFIMWTSTSHQRGGLVKFLRRRVYRVYPLWWIALTLWIVIRLVLPDRLHNADVTLHSLLCSYLLVPHFHHVFIGRIWPILVPGWTLQLEIFFYLVFSLSLLVSGRAARLTAILAALCLLTVLGTAVAPEGALFRAYTSPLLLEFAGGIILAALLPMFQRAPAVLGAAAIALGIGLVIVNYGLIVEGGFGRVLILGIPAALIVGGALVLEPVLTRRPSSLLLLFGDASYSLYLTHSVAISAAAVIWERLHLPHGSGVATIPFIPFALAGCLVFAVIVYRWVEKPLLNKLLPSGRGGAHIPALPTTALEEGRAEAPASSAVLPAAAAVPVPEPGPPSPA